MIKQDIPTRVMNLSLIWAGSIHFQETTKS